MALLVVIILLVGAVGVYSVLPRGASPSSSPGSGSAYAQLYSQVGPNGGVTKEMALEAFSLAIAPLPGVQVPSGPDPQLWEQADGTFAIDWIRPYLDQLTPDQKAAVDAALAPSATAPRISANPAGLRGQVFLADASDYTTDLSILHDALSKERTLGGSAAAVAFDYDLVINTQQLDKKSSLAYTNAGTEKLPDGTTMPYCEIHVNPLLATQSQAHSEFTQVSLAHEMWHCVQNAYLVGAATKVPGWILEGQAEWVGESVYSQTAIGAAWWQAYLQTPESPLYARTYDALGFYLHLVEKGINPGPLLLPMLKASDNDAAFTSTGANSDSYLDTWSSGLFRDQSLGADWYATGYPDTLIAQARALGSVDQTPPATRHEITIGAGDVEAVSATKVTNWLYDMTPVADIIAVQITGHARLKDAVADDIGLQSRYFCTRSGGCYCPPGQIYTGPETVEYMPANQIAELALTGGLESATGAVRGHSMDEYCKPMPSQQVGSCRSDCGHSNGDPHLRTINRYRYDFQAAGEFVLLRNTDSSVEVQARQEPYTGELNAFHAVSINTAIAVRTGGHKISIYATPDGPVLHEDGAVVDPASLPDLGAGGQVKAVSGGFEIDLADGSIVWALGLGDWGINAIVQPSSELSASGMGLIGPITPGNMGVPALPDGSQLPPAPDSDTRDRILYGQFADAWRVSDSTTLFDYDPGKSTASYTDRSFPTDADRHALAAALASPDPDQQQAADTACAGLTDADLQADCTFDVYATGDVGFAGQYGAEEDLYDSGIATPTQTPSTGGPTGVQEVVELQDLMGATIGPDDTLYLSIDTASGVSELLAVDPTTAAVKQQVQMRVPAKLHFAANSVWAAGQTTDANGQHCSVTRYDPQTLATIGDYPIPCTDSESAPRLTSMGDAVWFVDTTRTDPNTGSGTLLTRIDPNTNAPGASVALPQPDGCCQDSQGAVFCFCGQSDVWRLTPSDSGFVDLGSYAGIYPAGTGFWTEQGFAAIYVDGPGGPTVNVPFSDPSLEDSVVGGDPTGVYVQGEPPDEPLSRVPADGTAPVKLANAPTYGEGIDQTQLDYSPALPSFATPRGYLHLWMFKETPDSPLALWLQWAPLP